MKISKKRIPIVIGQGGETKHKIEKELGVKIDVDSKTGDYEVTANPDHPNYDPLSTIIAQKIIKAISRGFNPKKAIKLMDDNYGLEVFNLMRILGKSKKRVKRIKGRIIGRNGEMRKAIERFTDSFVSVYGKTASIIGTYEDLTTARKAIDMLIRGAPHHTVLRFLEDKYSSKKKEEFRKFYKPEF